MILCYLGVDPDVGHVACEQGILLVLCTPGTQQSSLQVRVACYPSAQSADRCIALNVCKLPSHQPVFCFNLRTAVNLLLELD